MSERRCPICQRPHKHLACKCNHWDMIDGLYDRIDEMSEQARNNAAGAEYEVRRLTKRVAELEQMATVRLDELNREAGLALA